MGSLARIWLMLAGLVGGVLCSGLWGWSVVVALCAGVPCATARRGPWRAVAVVVVSFGLGAINAAVRSPERDAAAALAAGVPSCRVAGRTLEDAGGLGILAA
ncbi:MAG: hypothetical protein M3323_15995, partial [Actinomycetota bacterium]|nr:hypothetical protein [Actinomycetota bacterium]